MKVLYAVGAPRVSRQPDSKTPGPRSHIQGVTAGFSSLGHEVSVYMSSEQRVFASIAASEEGDLRLPSWKLAFGDFARILVGWVNKFLLWRHYGLSSPDVVYERYGSFQCLGRMFQRRGAFWIIESNGLFFREANTERRSLFFARLARLQERRVYKKADRIVAVSHVLKRMIIEEFDVEDSKVIVVPNGVNSEFFAPSAKAEFAFGDEKQVVGFVGQVIEWQALDYLIRAVRELPARYCVAVVGDGPARHDLEELAKSLGVADRVRFFGRVAPDRVARLLNGFSAGFSGHKSDGSGTYHSPLKMFEYAAAGVPIIASESDAADELCEIYPVASFVSGSVSSLAQAIVDAAEHTTDLETRAERAALVRRRFSWVARVDAMLRACPLEAVDEHGPSEAPTNNVVGSSDSAGVRVFDAANPQATRRAR